MGKEPEWKLTLESPLLTNVREWQGGVRAGGVLGGVHAWAHAWVYLPPWDGELDPFSPGVPDLYYRTQEIM